MSSSIVGSSAARRAARNDTSEAASVVQYERLNHDARVVAGGITRYPGIQRIGGESASALTLLASHSAMLAGIARLVRSMWSSTGVHVRCVRSLGLAARLSRI